MADDEVKKCLTAHENHSHYQVVIVCVCENINDAKIKEAIGQGYNTPGALSEQLNVGEKCGCCMDEINCIIDKACKQRSTLA